MLLFFFSSLWNFNNILNLKVRIETVFTRKRFKFILRRFFSFAHALSDVCVSIKGAIF